MPFLPVILLFAWHALSRGAAFGLGWATALFFGQIPGNKGRVVSVVALFGAAWVIITVGAGLPIGLALAGRALGLLPGDAAQLDPWLLLALAGAVVLMPPAIVAFVEFAGFDSKRSWGRWLRRVPTSYLLAGSIGISVLQMIVITPIVTLRRWREGRRVAQIPLVIAGRRGIDDLADELQKLLRELGFEPERDQLRGPVSWPFRTLRYAAREMLGSVVEGQPVRLKDGSVELVIHATDVAVTAPKDETYRIRAAIERELAFANVFLTWSEDSQRFEKELMRLGEKRDGSLDSFVGKLDALQERIDRAALKSDEWNLLYRLRLQVERQARLETMERLAPRQARRKVQRTG